MMCSNCHEIYFKIIIWSPVIVLCIEYSKLFMFIQVKNLKITNYATRKILSGNPVRHFVFQFFINLTTPLNLKHVTRHLVRQAMSISACREIIILYNYRLVWTSFVSFFDNLSFKDVFWIIFLIYRRSRQILR